MEKCGMEVFLKDILSDEQVLTSHIAVYMAILQLWNQNNKVSPFQVTRKKIMRLAHIEGIATYHKCIKELEILGYIHYQPSYHPKLGSKVFLRGEGKLNTN